MYFYVPPHMVRNYEDFLKTDVCRDIKWCRLFIPDDKNNEWVTERAEVTRINYKSKQYGADGSLSIRLSKNSKIKKGDVIYFGGKYYLTSWYVHDVLPDSQTTMIDHCNVRGYFIRRNDEYSSVDPNTGEILEFSEPYKRITNDVYGFYLLNGNYEKRLKNSQAGLFNDNRLSFICQANPDTNKIKRGDIFVWHDEVHQVDDISLTEVDENCEGLLTIHLGLTLNDDAYELISDQQHEDDEPWVRPGKKDE